MTIELVEKPVGPEVAMLELPEEEDTPVGPREPVEEPVPETPVAELVVPVPVTENELNV